MGSKSGGSDAALDHGYSIVLAIAKALREEFGVQIDAHPGGVGSEAGTVNRAFRTAAGVILGSVVSTEDDLAAVLTWMLRRTAMRRLVELGVVGPRAEALLVMEPSLRDRWLAYLALAPATIINDLLTHAPGGDDRNPQTTPP
jgi:hypothetical protein